MCELGNDANSTIKQERKLYIQSKNEGEISVIPKKKESCDSSAGRALD